MTTLDTKSALLAEAEILMRTVGYAALSYADLSERVGIRKASIHYHFPKKEMLGAALVDLCLKQFTGALDGLLEKPISSERKLLAYAELFADGMRSGMRPLCGALAADAADLPPVMQYRLKKFFDLHLEWLERVLKDGVATQEFRKDLSPGRSALVIVSAVEGACLVAWAVKDPSVVMPAMRQVIKGMSG